MKLKKYVGPLVALWSVAVDKNGKRRLRNLRKRVRKGNRPEVLPFESPTANVRKPVPRKKR